MATMMFGIHDEAQTRAVLDDYLANWQIHGYGMWMLHEKSGGEFVGECGLRWRDDSADAAFRFALLPAYWGRGYAREAAAATLDFGFGQAGLDHIVAVVEAGNAASFGLLTRLGFTKEREFENEGEHLVFFGLAKPD